MTPRFFEYKVLKLIINVKLNNFVMFLLGVQVFNPQISPLFKFTFLQVVCCLLSVVCCLFAIV